jgi:hypothetical protein
MVNVVAERLLPKVRSRYYVETFGHLYAGKNNAWFYRKWSKGYSKFNEAARAAYSKGLRFTASFDLTAYYDSLDHGVLKHFLGKIHCEEEFGRKLAEWLSVWTATERRIYHHHGIPQGPLGSGLLSEVVLQHLDQHHRSAVHIRYLRYVDDIRLFARSEVALREMIIRLDMLSKDIGLFPQSSKIEIHEVRDIEEELKSVSRPAESVIRRKKIDQQRLTRRLFQLTPRFQIRNETRFKYLLAYASPSARLSYRVWRIYDERPDLYSNLMRYFAGYKVLPRSGGERFIVEIRRKQLYAAITTALVQTAEGRLNVDQKLRADRIVRRLWNPRSLAPDLLSAVGQWLLRCGSLTPKQVQLAVRNTKDWWVRCQLVSALSGRFLGKTFLTTVVNERLSDDVQDVAIAAASKLVAESVSISRPIKEIQRGAGHVLRQLGVLQRVPRGACGIDASMTSLLGRAVSGINWQLIFGSDYAQAEKQAVSCRAFASTDMTSFVNALDVFNDWLLMRVYLHEPALGIYTLGSIGSVLNSTRFKARYPDLHKMIVSAHGRRLESMLSHPVTRSTGRPTGRIRFSYLSRIKPLMVRAFKEVARNW